MNLKLEPNPYHLRFDMNHHGGAQENNIDEDNRKEQKQVNKIYSSSDMFQWTTII